MTTQFDIEKVHQFKPAKQALNLEAAIKEANRCLLCHDAPCSKCCPAGTDPGKFIRQIKFDNIKGAARTIRSNNVLGAVCAHICPVDKLCEKECSINSLEQPINISGLQQFACQYGKQTGLEPLEQKDPKNKKVAVIGAGPAGLSCAAELAKLGYPVTLFEKESEAGGIARWNIPSFRLPTESIKEDLDYIKTLNIEMEPHVEFNSAEEITRLLSEGFSAVFVGIGLAKPLTHPIFLPYENATDYFKFLYSIKTNRENNTVEGKSIVVIGAGSVAMDSACTAAALGAKSVTVLYRRSALEMPADKAEIELAHQLGVNFNTNAIVTSVTATHNHITHLQGTKIAWTVPGSRNPSDAEPIEGTEFSLNADLVIQAIGTTPDASLLSQFNCSNKGMISVDPHFATTIPSIFSAGDVVNGGTTIAQAVGEGKAAAKCIDQYLSKGSRS